MSNSENADGLHQGSTNRNMAVHVQGDSRDSTSSSELHLAYEQQLRNELALSMQREALLLDALNAANEIIEAKTLFLCNMAHELRTPLNAIIGFSELISSQMPIQTDISKYADYAKDIHQAGIYLLRLTNDLLDIARIEASQLVLADEEVDLPDCIAACFHMLEQEARPKQIFLSRDIPPDLPLLRGDVLRVQQIIINLVGNAIKFTPPQGKVHVSAYSADGSIHIHIADTGIGISSDDMDKIFKIFGQVPNPLTRARDGAGLGLPLAKKLTELHDGTLEIDSSPGRGTSVFVIFPPNRVAAPVCQPR